MSSRPLLLLIEIDSEKQNFEIADGEDFYIGADASSHLEIPGEDVAPRHLRIHWKSGRVRIEDLETEGGTYRLPQGAPFSELMGAENGDIALQIGDHKLRIQWALDGILIADAKGATKTNIALVPPLLDLAPKKAKRRVKVEDHVELTINSRLRAFENLSLLFFLAVVFRLLAEMRDKLLDWRLLTVPESLRKGVALDYLFLYTEEGFFLATLGWGAFGFLFALFFLRPMSRRLANRFGGLLPTRVLLIFSGLRGARWIAGLVSLMLLLWVPLLAFNYGIRPADLGFLSQLRNYLQKTKPGEWELRESANAFKGSSLLYKAWIISEREDLLRRCRGFGLETWPGQQRCSVLFFSKTLEGYARFQPRITQELAAAQVVLASLDGLVRVFTLDGVGSSNLDLFLEPLDRVGLAHERRQILAHIESFQGMNFDVMLKGLVSMRHRSETQLNFFQARLPKSLVVRFPGPLELGF